MIILSILIRIKSLSIVNLTSHEKMKKVANGVVDKIVNDVVNKVVN